MALSKYSILDGIPMPDNLMLENDLSTTLDFKKYLNVGFDIRKTEDRVIEHNKLISIIEQGRESYRLRDLNLLIESYIYTLLYMSTITDLDNSKPTPHYYKRQLVISDDYLLISNKYLEDLLYTFQSTWGGKYGSISYNMFLAEDNRHYLNPSQVVNKCFTYLFQRMVEGSNDLVSQWAEESIFSFNSDLIDDDIRVYDISIKLLGALELEEIINNLNFLSEYLPETINWYEVNRANTFINQDSRNQALLVINKIVSVCYKKGFSSELLTDLFFSYMHQDFPVSFEELYKELLSIRKSTSFFSGNSIEEKKVNQFIEGMKISKEISLRDKSYLILRRIAPPGGYNTLLTITALSLLNRAYIISHFSRTLFSNTLIKDRQNSQFISLYGRVVKLIYMAGYTLKKTNLDHLVISGNNLIYLSGLENNSQAYIKDLTA